MKIAILSDTHNLLRPEVIEIIKGSDAVIHGGDINSQDILDEIKSVMKPNVQLFVVKGNNDKEWAENLPESLEFELCGLKFFVAHNKKDIPQNVTADIIIFGHSHKYYEENIEGQLWLNPGSCGRKRFSLPLTMAVMNVNDNGYSIKKIELEE
ncbi:MAG: metallophosphoesterase family protein [Clostridia bacterium]|nr:metallophosphoesterase family protein [Clostridia bacterium]MCI9086206.1 metallophosphoesterase family protein [Clostridia bacterium]NDO20484.1 metallophosphoesterase family protein [Lachnospiraceae bacterium MD329]